MFLDKKKTYTGATFMNMIEPDLSLRAVKKQLMYQTNTMNDYNMQFHNYKLNYRARYSDKFLKKHGFFIETVADIKEIDDTTMNDYMLGVDSDFESTIRFNVGSVSIETQLFYHLQEFYTWSNMKQELEISGDTYFYQYTSFRESDDPNVEDNTNYIVGHFLNASNDVYEVEIWNVYGIDKTLTVKYYQTTDPDYPGIGREYTLHIEFYKDLPSSMFMETEVVMAPIVILKENNHVIPEDKDLKKMLRRLNFDYDSFEEILGDKDEDKEGGGETETDNAYMMSALPIHNPYHVYPGHYSPVFAQHLPAAILMKVEDSDIETNREGTEKGYTITQEVSDEFYLSHMKEQNYLARALFKTFAYYAGMYSETCVGKRLSPFYMAGCVNNGSSTGSVEVEQSDFKMWQNYSIKVETKQGRVRPQVSNPREQGTLHFEGRRYTPKNEEGKREVAPTPGYTGEDILTLKVQISSDQYQIMTITNYESGHIISGKYFHIEMGHPNNEGRLLMPAFVEKKLSFKEYVTVHEHSIALMAYFTRTVTVSGWKILAGIALGAVLCLTGAGCTIGAAIIQAAISLAVVLVSQKIMEMIDSEILRFIVSVVIMLVSHQMNYGNLFTMGAEGYLKLAFKVGEMATSAYEAHKNAQEKLDTEMTEMMEKIDERVEAGEYSMQINPKAIMSAHTSFESQVSPEGFFNSALGASLYDYEQYYNVDGEIELRKQVQPG